MEFSCGFLVPIGEYEFMDGFDAGELFPLFYIEKIHDPTKTWINFIKNGGKFWAKSESGEMELLIECRENGPIGNYWTLKYFGYNSDNEEAS